MIRLPGISNEKQRLLESVIDRVAVIPHLVALGLGGSYATGTQTPRSDLDFGLYYRKNSPFAVSDIAAAARDLSQGQTPTVTDFYEWGPWVNGGAWIPTPAGKVDFLYRNIDQIEETIDKATRGVVEHDYGQQPPYGFISVIYLAETRIAVPLYDPTGLLDGLKARVAPYPEKLRSRILADSLWSAEFTLGAAEGAAAAGDVYRTAGCLTRAAAEFTQVLFALNREYFLTDKQALPSIERFTACPQDYVARIRGLLASPGVSAETLTRTVSGAWAVWREIVDLTDGEYRPKYHIPKG